MMEVIKMKIKGMAAAVLAAGLLVTTPAFAAAPGVEHKEPVRQEKLDREEKKPEVQKPENREKVPENRDLKKQDIHKNDRKLRKECNCEFVKDPLGALESKKSEVQRLQKEGKISKEKAETIIRKIDRRIAEIHAFNKLNLEQKREKLKKDCKEFLDSQVEKGRLEPEKAKRIYQEYSEKIDKWDGTGYPGFFRKLSGPKTDKAE